MASQVSIQPIPFGASQASGLEELAGAPQQSINAVTDAAGAVRRRPCIATWADFPATAGSLGSAVIGMYQWGAYLIYVTADRKLWAMSGTGVVTALSDATATTKLDGALRPTFAGTRTLVAIAGGGAPQKWTGAGLAARLGGSPPVMSHICAIAQRLAGNAYGASGEFFWTPPGQLETWNAIDFAEAEARADILSALHENTNELWAFGPDSTQVFAPDAAIAFADQRNIPLGLGAPDSVIRVDEAFAWLDNMRRFVLSSRRDSNSISTPGMDKTIGALGTVSDAWGFRARMEAYDLLAWVMPTESRSFYFETTSKAWGEWRGWSNGEWASLAIQSYCYWKDKNVHLVGLADGSIARLTSETYADVDAICKVRLRTGFVDRGSNAFKDSRVARLRMKRGVGDGTTEPVAELSWRDDSGPFCEPVRVSLGAPGDVKPTVELRSLGTYQTREWQLEVTDDVEFVLASADEQFAVMEG